MKYIEIIELQRGEKTNKIILFVHSHEKRYMGGAISLMSNTWIYVQLQIHQQIEDLKDRNISHV